MKFGLIGAGGIGAVRAAALKTSQACDLTAISDLDEPRARALAPQARFHATAEALFDDAAVVAVVISTPPQFHEALAVAALDAGKHVLVEKPMAPTLEACQRMLEAAERNGRLLSVGFNHRYFDAVKRVPPAQIEAIDMARRGIHNEGARTLQERLDGKAEIDIDTARRLFTLICALIQE